MRSVDLVVGIAVCLSACRREPDWDAQRQAMVRDDIEARGVRDPRVLAALRRVPRHAFVPAPYTRQAYTDQPLPIGFGQTISQPYVVAFMTEAVAPQAADRCLEIGTGSGYQAAVLAELCAKVFSIEYLPELAELGKRQLRAQGYGPDRVELFTGDGYQGWPEAAPFQVIVVTAAPSRVPAPLLDQLAVGGRLIAPVGPDSGPQRLELWRRVESGRGEGAFVHEELADVRFVPFLGEAARRR
ncbi:MAG: protein-L-isoaspartate(D-aspartate) O-methyltransferase [Polyangiaceae bacterium]